MSLLPPPRSARWILVFLAATVLVAAGMIWAGSAGANGAPPQDTVLAIVGASGLLVAVLSLLGAFGARATFACALLGLLIGLGQMIWVATHAHEGMADLAAFASFLLYGAIGLVVGILIDFGRWLGTRRASPQNAR